MMNFSPKNKPFLPTQKSKLHCFLLTGLFYFLPFLASNIFAQGNLLVTPKRVVFDGTKRSEELNLANTGKDSVTYAISFIQIRMKEDGSFEQITEPDPGQKIASNNLRFFPRSVTLGPNESQSVKLQLIKSNELDTGEYRSHLYFRAIPNNRPLGEEKSTNDSSISVKLKPVFGLTMPVIIRVGPMNASVDMSDLSLNLNEISPPVIKMTFHRHGDMSAYGDITVNHISTNGKISRVGAVKGLAVYCPNPKREVKLYLDTKEQVDYHSGKLQVIYSDQSSSNNKIAEQELVLN